MIKRSCLLIFYQCPLSSPYLDYMQSDTIKVDVAFRKPVMEKETVTINCNADCEGTQIGPSCVYTHEHPGANA